MRPVHVSTGELASVLQSHSTQLVPRDVWPAPIREIPNVVQAWAWRQPDSARTVTSDGTTIGGVLGAVQTIRATTARSPTWKVDRWYYRILDSEAFRLGPFKDGGMHHTDHLDAWPVQRPQDSVTIDTTPVRSQIEALLYDVGLGACDLLIVDSVHRWAEDHGTPQASPFLAALAATRSDGVPTIVLLWCITGDIRAGIIGGMEARGFATEAERLKVPSAFLEHLILHEAAHLLLPDGASEDDCDRWAFERLAGRWSATT